MKMPFPERAAEHLTYSFIKEALPDKDQRDLERIEYGLASFFITFPKLVALVALAIFTNQYINNFFLYYVVTQGSYTLVRSYAWGLHLKTDLSCLTSGLLLLFGITFIGIFYPLPFYILLIFWGASFRFLYLHAPADTAARPLRSQTLRKKLRKKLLVVVSLLFIITLANIHSPYSTLISLGVFGESLFTTPFVYKLFKLKGGTNQ